jgi:hypothetical protein
MSDMAEVDQLFAGVDTICDAALKQTEADGAALAVLTRRRRVRDLLYASDPIARRLDELQYTIGEGPCFDAYLEYAPQFYPELTSAAHTPRWPTFAADAGDLGVQALFAFPVPNGRRPLGVLELYRLAAGGLSDAGYAAASACAAAIAKQLESNWQQYVARFGNIEQAIDAAATAGIHVKEPPDPFARTQIHVAAGMVSIQLGISADEAVDRLRAYSYAGGRSVSSVAADIIARRLTLDDQRDV